MADEDLLQSWKEIAAHLGRSERTCRRWETDFRLPVHRMDGSVRSSVFAYRSELDRWMDQVLHEEDEIPPVTSRLHPTKKTGIILSLFIALAVALAVVMFRMDRPRQQRPQPSGKPTLAILPFTNNTGDENLDFWENALADLLASDLAQSRYLTVLPQDRVFFVLRNLDLLDAGAGNAIDLERVASRAHVDNIIVGNFVKAGQRFRINATVRHIPSGEGFVLPSVEAKSQEEILVKIDEISTGIKFRLLSPVDVSGSDIDLDMGSITTSSVEAYRFYIDGWLSYFKGRTVDSLESLKIAVEIDPEFAMAHNFLALCYRSLPGYEDEAEEALSRAFELSHHTSPRERFFIQAIHYRSRGQRGWGNYLETCQEFVRVYPDDYRAVLCLGEGYLWIEDWDRCIETLESAIDTAVWSQNFVYLRQAYGALGKYEGALAAAEAAPGGVDSLQYRHQRSLNLIYQQRFGAALLEADRMLEHTPGYPYAWMVKGDVHFFRAEWDQAEVFYRELLKPVAKEPTRLRMRLEGLRRLTNLYLAKGQFEQALDFASQAIEEVTAVGERKWLLALHFRKATILLAQGDLSGANAEIQIALEEAERRDHVTGMIASLDIHGMILLEMGNVGEAVHAAGEMKEEIDGWLDPKLIRRWHHLEGHIALARNNVSQAVEQFEMAVSLLPYQHELNGDEHAVYYTSLAYAYYQSGDLARAQEWYENTLTLTSGRLSFGEQYAKSHFMLGKIFEQRGMNAAAIRSYRTFLDLWREADATTPELEVANRSVAALLG